MTQDPLRLLRSLTWLALDDAAFTQPLRDWLMEEDSMTRRFETSIARRSGWNLYAKALSMLTN